MSKLREASSTPTSDGGVNGRVLRSKNKLSFSTVRLKKFRLRYCPSAGLRGQLNIRDLEVGGYERPVSCVITVLKSLNGCCRSFQSPWSY